MHERGRLLERLQQAIRDLVVHGVDALEDEHASLRLEGRARGRHHDGLVDVVDPHHVRAARAHPRQIGVGPVGDPQPHVVRIRGARGEQLRRERPRHRPLPHPGRPVEQIRVRG